jgi:trehalose utilization protein
MKTETAIISWYDGADPTSSGWIWECGKIVRGIPGHAGTDRSTDHEDLEDLARADPFFPTGSVVVKIEGVEQ